MAEEGCDLHLLTGCTFCSGKYTCLEPLKATKKKARRPVKAARKDTPMTTADLVAAGKMCGYCRTLFAPIGCQCSRRAAFDRAVPDSQEWLAEHHLELDTGRVSSKPELIAAGLAFTSYARAARRAGIVRDGDNAEQVEARRGILHKFGVDPKWTPPRTNEADPLPV